jgi:hypothetical protein
MSQQPDGMYQIALKERAMQQPKTKHDRSAYEQSVDRLASAMREMLGMGPPKMAMSEPIDRVSRKRIRSMPNAP